MALALNSFGQYPFEKFPAIKYRAYKDWKVFNTNNKEHKTEFVFTIPKFFNKKDSLTLLLTSFDNKWDSSFITILKNGEELQRFFEPMFFYDTNLMEDVMTADINGDKLQDVKLVIPYMSNGLGLNTRVIYLFQHNNKSFNKISFDDKMFGQNRPERDFNGDGNYEIITMTLISYGSHSYFAFNLFNFKNSDLVSVNDKYNYPILIQFLYRDNFKITHKISRQKMKDFAQAKPEDYDKQ
ncbi:MAG: hypothetical protein ACJ75B_22510 [Flavisolibacter sp.]